MHAVRILLLILLTAVHANAAWIDDQFATAVAIEGASSPTCSTPSTGNTLNEGFLGAGYESTWSETVGTNGTINEDYTLTGSPPTGSCTEGLLTSVTTGNGGGSGAMSFTTWDNGSAITQATNDIDIYAFVKINSATLPAGGDIIRLIHWDDDTSPFTYAAGCADVHAYYTTEFTVQGRGATNSSAIAATASVWYTLHLHLDGSGTTYFQIDGGTQESFNQRTADCRYLHIGPNQVDDDEAIEVEWGYIWVTVAAD